MIPNETTSELTCTGYLEGVLPTEATFADLAEGILSGEIARPEFEVELINTQTGETVDSVHVSALFPCDDDSPEGRWCITRPVGNELNCLAQDQAEGRHRWYIMCGAEHEILDCCAVPWEVASGMLLAFCRTGAHESFNWVDAGRAMNL